MGLHKEELKLEIENIKANLRLFLEAEEYYNNHRYKKAAELYRLSALPKDGETMYNWGVILGDEIDGVKYITQSIQLLKKAADLGYVSAYGALALAYLTKDDLKKDDYEQAFYYANIAAENQDGTGYHVLGYLYYYGIYVEQDRVKARNYFERVKESRYKKECYTQSSFYVLGMMNYNGDGGEKNYDVARQYFESYLLGKEGENETDIDVYQHLGMIYLKGLETEQNTIKAYDYFIKSEEIIEDDEIEFWLGIIMATGLIEDSTQEHLSTIQWLEKSHKNGNKDALKCIENENNLIKFVEKLKRVNE